jgi:hypothetical protein
MPAKPLWGGAPRRERYALKPEGQCGAKTWNGLYPLEKQPLMG